MQNKQYCAKCGLPVKGDHFKSTPYHGECWLEELRHRARVTQSEARRNVIISIGISAKESLRRWKEENGHDT